MTIQEINQLGDKILDEWGINNAKSLGLQACAEAIRLALEVERISKEFSICLNGEPAKMTSQIGFLPINSEGMRKAVDEISQLNSELSHSHKECEMLWRKVGELEAEAARLRCAEQERKYYKFCNGNVLKTLEIAEVEMERLQRERDAAVGDIENLLRCAKDRDCGKYCAHDIKKDCENGWVCCGPEWRGPQEQTP